MHRFLKIGFWRNARGEALALALLLPIAPLVSAAHYRTLAGPSEGGPHAILVSPLPSYPNSLGVAKQMETLSLANGRLTFVELDSEETAEGLPAALGAVAFRGENRPHWLWIQRRELNESLKKPLIRITPETADALAAELPGLFEDKVTIQTGGIAEEFSKLAKRGVVTIEYPKDSRESRRTRYTRLLALHLLQRAKMLEPTNGYDWTGLQTYGEKRVALYDAEGIGGSGPGNLERIVNSRLDNAVLYRVCGEDIRDGALAAADVVIFPGGSGRGIGNGIQEKGREEVLNFIRNGGGYLGVCAGAYFAASGSDVYLHAIELKHSQPWPRGRGLIEIELTPEGQKLLGADKTVLETRYANGPVFLPVDQEGNGDEHFKVLATFKTPSTDRGGVVRTEMVGQAAIGAREYGDGRMLIVSPHPESHEEHYDLVARAISWTMGAD